MTSARLMGPSTIHTDEWALLMGCGEEKKDALAKSKNMQPYCCKMWELLVLCAESNWDLDAKQMKAHPTENGRKAVTQTSGIWLRKDTASAKAGADVDGGHTAAVKALTMKPL